MRVLIQNRGSFSARLYPRPSSFVRVLISKSGEPSQPKAPLSEFKACKGSDFNFRVPHQSKAPLSEFKIYKSIRVLIQKNSGAHQSKALFSEFNICKRSDLDIRGAPSVQSFTLGVQDL